MMRAEYLTGEGKTVHLCESHFLKLSYYKKAQLAYMCPSVKCDGCEHEINVMPLPEEYQW